MANCSKRGVIIAGCYGECTPDVFLLIELICVDWHRRVGWNSRQPLFYQQREASGGSNGASRRTCGPHIQKLTSAALVPR